MISVDYFLYLVVIVAALIINNLEVEKYLFGGFGIIVAIRYVHFFVSVSAQLKKFLKIKF